MNKVEFLDALRKRIDMLDDVEVSDILNEYSLHIECKVKCGMSEEEAVADFGDLSELAADILGAYHVKASNVVLGDVPPTEGVASAADCFSDEKDSGDSARCGADEPKNAPGVFVVDASGAVSVVQRAWAAVKSGVCGALSAVARGFSGFCGRCAHLCDGMWSKASGKRDGVVSETVSEKVVASVNPEGSVSLQSAEVSCSEGLFAVWRGFWRAAGRALAACWRLFLKAVKWCIIFCASLVVMFCAFASIALIFAFGASAVMAALGYPFWGVALVLLGVSASSVALTIMGFNVVRWHLLPLGGNTRERSEVCHA